MPRVLLSRRTFVLAGGVALARSALTIRSAEPRTITADVCIYGGTASGIVAAVTATRAQCRVVVIEPSRWLGGMTGGGLMHIDWGRPEAVGGMARTLLNDGLSDPQYRRMFADLVKTHAIEVLYEHRLAAVSRDGNAMRAITLDHAPPDRFGCPAPQARNLGAATVVARVFIDCSYEGDLMAKSGVAYTFGREAADQYGESLAGVRPNMGVYAIDPYVTPGEPRSGLLPFLQDRTMGPVGSADKLTMGYGFRWRFTTDPNQIPINPPEDYDPRTFELYRRAFRQKIDVSGRHMRKLGIYERQTASVHSLAAGNLSRSLVSPTVYGCNAEYPDGDWSTRARIWKFHQDFMRGMTHFLRTEPAVPDNLKQRAAKVGFTPGMFDDTGGWPHQLYVREARRMVSAYVVTQRDLEGATEPPDSVGLASYGVDDWPYATFPLDGKVALQGGDFSMLYLDEVHRGIYRIPYRAIVPRERECRNLIVPVCCSASHIAMTSIRMEPVWMILGEAAGAAAALAISGGTSVQAVDYPRLRTRLLELGARLDRPTADAPPRSSP
ncbi:MAG: FAD-dependent oxidoreductase [Verrucomicrobia bacterium]|nr:FAD-dependent oxidoreductase [Verrucomicrobiota bacterium]